MNTVLSLNMPCMVGIS